MVGNNIINNEKNNIANDILKFISDFHEKYNQKFDIEILITKLSDEKNELVNICQTFLDLMFTDGEKFFIDAENLGDNQSEDNESAENDNFEKEKENLIMKLNCLNIEDEEYSQDKEIFEEEETIKEYDKINFIRNKNGKTKIKSKLDGNIIEKLYIFKKA